MNHNDIKYNVTIKWDGKTTHHLNVSLDTPLHYNESKTLTDKDIEDALYVADITLNNLSDGDISMERIKAFVRTVLRKAQEK